MKKIWSLITWPYTWVRNKILFRRRIKELRRRDPFIYK